MTAPTVQAIRSTSIDGMIKQLITGIWLVAVLSGTTLFASGKLFPADDGKKKAEKIAHLNLEPISVALIRAGSVKGYLIVEPAMTYVAEGKKMTQPLDLLLQDAVVGVLYSNEEIDTDRLEKFDLEKFRTDLRDKLNTKLKKEMVREVLIKRIDYLTVDEIRDNKLRQG